MGLERLGLGAILDFSAGAAVANMGGASTAATRLKTSLQSIGRGAARAQRGVSQMASGAMRLLAPAVMATGAAAGVSVKKYLGFEEALTKIATILPGGNKAAEAWGDSIQGMGVKFGKASRDVGEGVYQAISASVPAGEALQFLDVVGRTATGGFTDLGASVKVVASTVNAYGKQLGETATYTDRATRASDVLLKAVELGQIEFSEMASTLGYILPTAAGAKVSMEEVAAAWATATASGQSASSSATALRQTIGAIIAPTKKARDQAEELGIQFNQQALEEKGLLGVLKDVGKAAGGNTKQLDALFGSIEALNIVMALSQDGAGAFERNLTAMNTAAGTTDRQFQAVAESSGFKLRQVWSALGVLAEQVGGTILKGFGIEGVGKLADLIQAKTPAITQWVREFLVAFREGASKTANTLKSVFLPILNRLVPGAGGLATKVGLLVGKMAPLVPIVMGLGAAAGPLLSILGGGLNTVIGLGSTLAGVLGGAKGLLPMLGAGPLGLIGILLAVGGAAIVASGKGGELKDAFGSLLGALSPLWDMLKEVGGFLATTVGASVQVAADFFTNILGPALSGVAQVVNEVVLPAIRWLVSALEDTIGGMGSFLDKTLAIDSRVESVRESLKGAKKEAEAKAGLKGLFGAMKPPTTGPKRLTANEVAALNERERLTREAARPAALARLGVGGAGASDYMGGGALGRPVLAGQEAAMLIDGINDATSKRRRAKEARADRRAKAAAAKCVEVTNNMNLDGKRVHHSVSRASLELTERAGAQVTPYQRRQIIERGSVGRA